MVFLMYSNLQYFLFLQSYHILVREVPARKFRPSSAGQKSGRWRIGWGLHI